jgi:hypothetical protein
MSYHQKCISGDEKAMESGTTGYCTNTIFRYLSSISEGICYEDEEIQPIESPKEEQNCTLQGL